MKPGRSGIGLLLAGTILATSASFAGAWTYSTEEVDYVGGPFIVGTRNGQDYMYRVGIATNDSADPETLNVQLNYHNGFIGQYWYSIDNGLNWLEVPKNQATLSVENVAIGDSVQLRAVTCYYRYLSTSPWGEADASIGDEYYFAFPPGGHYWEGGTVNPTGFVVVTSSPSADAWTYSTEEVDYVGGSHVVGTKTGQSYMYRVGVATNDSGAQETLNVALNYHNGFIGQYRYSVDDGENWIDVPKNQTTFSVENVASGDSVQLRAVTCYYRYLSTSPWGEADNSIGDEYYFAWPPGGHYWEGETVNPTGFVAVTSYTGPADDLDGDGQTVSEGDCNDLDATIYTGAPEVCDDGIDQDCDGADEECGVPTVTSAGEQVWMDRNLGATQVATYAMDEDAYGDLYQWGRLTDGHENRTSSVTTTLSSSDIPGHGDFISTNSEAHDWRVPQNSNLWQGGMGINNPCPSGFRLPTETELSVERTSWNPNDFQAPFNSSLRLTVGGKRYSDGYVYGDYLYGYYWSSTVSSTHSRYLFFEIDSGYNNISSNTRKEGMSVRCIQDDSAGVDDVDGDGQTVTEGDCNDLDATIYTGAPEVCGDHLDQDCDGADEICTDDDGDGQTESEGDCNDLDDTIYTGAPETCGDGIDQNCDGGDELCGLPAGTVMSSGQIWMDRNLGAAQVGISFDDEDAYGDLYQWGRLNDGHEIRTSDITSTRSNTDVPGHDDFITPNVSGYDWRVSANNDLWQGVSGINNPCPSGFRVPTVTELEIERLSWATNNSAGAFTSPAKLVMAGKRRLLTGVVEDSGEKGEYWSSTTAGTVKVYYLHMGDDFAVIWEDWRGSGNSVRCIMDIDPDQDLDMDGQTVNEGDCSGLDATIYTGASEICEDGIDQDCNGMDAPCVDQDGDGQSVSQGDCNDLDDTIYIGAPEVCEDTIDQNCDGEDESCPEIVVSAGMSWMDRNLGASRVATSYMDSEAYGNLYQWGRLADGHESRTSQTTSTRSILDAPGHDDFITVSFPFTDWRTPNNGNLWQGVAGINNPCPTGFRLPTATELDTERASWHPQNSAGAYASSAKFVVAGYRDSESGGVNEEDSEGYYWTSTITSYQFGDRADFLVIRPSNTQMSYVNNRATGHSVRCIQDSVIVEDLDQDGQTVDEGDCDDLDATIYTGASEICEDYIDQNCDGWDEPCGLPEGTVFSAGEIWMDRNLGASQVATSSDDAEAYGDLYQWGRLTDGHEGRTSSTTSVISNTDVPGHDNFITVDSGTNDWRSPQNGDLWESESGTNNPCPSGFRLPTVTEIEVEINSWVTDDMAGAYSSPLKLVAAGQRNAQNGNISDEGVDGEYWSGTDSATSWFADIMYFRIGYAGSLSRERGNGLSVRCIMD